MAKRKHNAENHITIQFGMNESGNDASESSSSSSEVEPASKKRTKKTAVESTNHSTTHKESHPNEKHHELVFSDELKQYIRGKPLVSLGHIHKFLHQQNYSNRISRKAAAALSGILQGMMIDLILEIDSVVEKGKKRIAARHISLAIKKDRQFVKLLSQVTIPDSGVAGIVSGRTPMTRSKHRKS